MRKFAITVNGQSYEVEVEEIGGAPVFAAAPVAAPVAAPAPVAEPEPVVEDVTDDSELIAVIAAAIAAFDNSGKALVVRRVRKVSGWNRAARAEQVYRF